MGDADSGLIGVARREGWWLGGAEVGGLLDGAGMGGGAMVLDGLVVCDGGPMMCSEACSVSSVGGYSDSGVSSAEGLRNFGVRASDEEGDKYCSIPTKGKV